MANQIDEILGICKEFLKIPSPIGYENHFLDYLNSKIKKLGFDTILSDMYLVVKPRNMTQKPRYLFSVHVDRHSLIRNDDNKIEFLANYFKKKLGLSFKREEIEEDEHRLVYQLNGTQKNYDVSLTDKYIRFKNDSCDLKFQRLGGESFFEKIGLRYMRDDVVSFNVSNLAKPMKEHKIVAYYSNYKKKEVLFDFENKITKDENIFCFSNEITRRNNLVSGQIDNVISAAVLYYLLENTNFNCGVIFTTKEEIGQSFDSICDYINECGEEKVSMITLDTSPYLNFDDLEDGSLVLRYGDEREGFDKKMTEGIKKELENLNIPFSFKPSFEGRTELGAVYRKSKGKIQGTTLQIPTIYYHTSYETCTIESLKNYLRIIEKLCLK